MGEIRYWYDQLFSFFGGEYRWETFEIRKGCRKISFKDVLTTFKIHIIIISICESLFKSYASNSNIARIRWIAELLWEKECKKSFQSEFEFSWVLVIVATFTQARRVAYATIIREGRVSREHLVLVIVTGGIYELAS